MLGTSWYSTTGRFLETLAIEPYYQNLARVACVCLWMLPATCRLCYHQCHDSCCFVLQLQYHVVVCCECGQVWVVRHVGAGVAAGLLVLTLLLSVMTHSTFLPTGLAVYYSFLGSHTV